MPDLSPMGQEMLERHPGLVIVPTSGGGSRQLRQRLSPDAERHLRKHGDKVTLKVGDKLVRVQVGLTLTIIGSKEAVRELAASAA